MTGNDQFNTGNEEKIKNNFKVDKCSIGTCRNTAGSFYCEEECPGLVQDLDIQDEKRVEIEQCSEKLEINGQLFVKTDSESYLTGDNSKNLCLSSFGWFIAPSCDIETSCLIELFSDQITNCPDQITKWDHFIGGFRYPSPDDVIIREIQDETNQCSCGPYGKCSSDGYTCECSAGFVLGQFQQCEPVPVLKVNIKTNPQSNSNLDSKLSGHYVSRWSNEKRQWTYVKNRDEKIHFYFDISTKFWNIQDSNSKSEISFSISSNISPITPGANCQVFIQLLI
jgi:hypothetical protein